MKLGNLPPDIEELTTTLRSAIRDDVSAILRLERDIPSLVHWSEQAYRAAFEPGAPNRLLLVIEEDRAVQGFLVARLNGREAELENLAVAALQRRRGLASQLLKSLIAQAAERNVEKIVLEVRESNSAARALYKKLGFRAIGWRKSYYTNPSEDALLFELLVNCTITRA